jgi:peptide/nickel transport system permease protein
MFSYIIKRILLMIPTLIGIITICFVLMRMAPGDPLELRLGTLGEQKEGSIQREQYKLMAKQFGLDKPMFLNFRSLRDYSKEIDKYIPLIDDLDAIQQAYRVLESEELSFLDKIGVLDVNLRLSEYARLLKSSPGEAQIGLNSLSNSTKIAIQIRLEKIGRWAVKPLYERLIIEKDIDKIARICKGLKYATTGGFRFDFNINEPPGKSELGKIKQAWALFVERAEGKLEDPDEDRRKEIDHVVSQVLDMSVDRAELPDTVRHIKTLADEGELWEDDCRYIAQKIVEADDIKSIYLLSYTVATLISPRGFIELTPGSGASEKEIRDVQDNWKVLYEQNRELYDPPGVRRSFTVFSESQYFNNLVDLISFRFVSWKSLQNQTQQVGARIKGALRYSLPLMLVSQILVYLIAVPAGILCSINRGNVVDRGISLNLFLLYSIPSYVAALLMILVFSFYIDLFPMRGYVPRELAESVGGIVYIFQWVRYSFMPIVCLSIFSVAGLAMYTRTSLLEVANQDYIRTARAKGVSEFRVVMKHILRNGLIPIITLFASFLPGLLGGAIIIETLFDIPGMGKLAIDSIGFKDYTTLIAIFYIDALAVLVSLLLTDILYVTVDPRISFGSQEVR